MVATNSKMLERFSTAVLYGAFALTGVGVALPGAALPGIVAHWSMGDRGAGFLFLMAWSGSSLGALLCRGRAAAALGRGVTLLTLVCVAIVLAATYTPGAGGQALALGLFFLYGVALGITMTSTTLLRAGRRVVGTAQELNRLNLMWVAGALLCPTIAVHALRTGGIRYAFGGLGLLFALDAIWVWSVEARASGDGEPVRGTEAAQRLSGLPLLVGLFVALTVGVESSMSGWLTTYAERVGGRVAGAVTVSTLFWLGLLVSRAVSSTPMFERYNSPGLLRSGSWMVAVGGGALWLGGGHAEWALMVGAFVTGLGIGPMYPMLLALVLPRYGGSKVFFIAGVGSGVVPWLTGAVSGWNGSLRMGLMVAWVGAGLMVAVRPWLPRGFRERE
ncbi:MFS transporter [Granulicella sibirica]|uniref:Major facilitator superfamily MFS_1 n=1 Tax=Granulicella sibirica TaxID=2479048 RepID=A0A4Q0TB70_9BACT|nr:MFS transporter [Granulicella sibirica]RXH58901.1 major facilitator superfamily MFS_1 [Granulicella sibirica]